MDLIERCEQEFDAYVARLANSKPDRLGKIVTAPPGGRVDS